MLSLSWDDCNSVIETFEVDRFPRLLVGSHRIFEASLSSGAPKQGSGVDGSSEMPRNAKP